MGKWWDSIPQPYRFVIIGGFGTIIGWIIYNAVYLANPITNFRAPVSWSISYVLGIILQHWMHYRLTFTNSEATYISSLGGAYFSYAIVLVFSTLANFGFVEIIEIGHQVSWILTTIISAVLSYFFLRRFSFGN